MYLELNVKHSSKDLGSDRTEINCLPLMRAIKDTWVTGVIFATKATWDTKTTALHLDHQGHISH